MIVDFAIIATKAFLVLFMVLNLAGVLGWIERKGSALIQDRIGANRASIFGFAGMGLVNTLIADPLKFLTKEDFIPPAGDKFLHTLAPCMALFTALVTFAVIPFGVGQVPGVRAVDNRLEVHAEPGAVPGLQGAGRSSGEVLDLTRGSLSPAATLATGLGGALLALWGLRRLDAAGVPVATIGMALLARTSRTRAPVFSELIHDLRRVLSR